MTSEWSHRTELITFSLVSVRSRVLAAKLIASLALAAAMLLMTVAVVGAGVFVASPGGAGAWAGVAPVIGQSTGYLTAGMVAGVAFGTVLLASAPAIVALYTLPTASAAMASVSVFTRVAWLDTARGHRVTSRPT